MKDAQPGDLGNVADPVASVAFTVTMPNRVLRAARGMAAAEGVSTNDVLRRFTEAGVDDRAGPRAPNLARLPQGLVLIDGPSVPAANRHRFVKVNEPKI